MSEHYVSPPPPYEFSLQHDRKVTDSDIQTLQVSKASPFEDERSSLPKHARSLTDKSLGDVHTHPAILKRAAAGLDGAGPRTPRPLPPSPAGTPAPGSAFAEVKKHTAQSDHASPHAPHPSSSTHLPPSHYPPQLPCDAPRQDCSDRWPETSFRRPSHKTSHSMLYSPPQNKSAGSHLSFDPSVAYADSRAWSSFQAPRGVATSLYSHAVSSHLYPDSASISASRQSHIPARFASLRQDQPDARSIRSRPSSVSEYPPPQSPTTSLYTPRTRSSSGYEKRIRWGASVEDKKEIYHASG